MRQSRSKTMARLDVVPHEGREEIIRRGGIIEAHLQQRAFGGIHRGFPQLFGVHLSQAFVTLYSNAGLLNAVFVCVNLNTLRLAIFNQFVNYLVALFLGVGVLLLLAGHNSK